MTARKLGTTIIMFSVAAFLLWGLAFAQQSPYADIIAAAGTADDYPASDIVVVFDSTDVEVEESGLSHIYIHRLVKVLTEDGAIGQSVHRFDYDPASNMVEILKVAVHREDGSMQEIDGKEAVDRPQPQRMILWGPRMKLIGVPNLKMGDTVEIKYYTKGFIIAYLNAEEDESRYIPPMRGHYYDTIMFGGRTPVKHKVYVLKTLKNVPVQYKVYNGNVAVSATFDNDYNYYIFEKEDIPVYSYEPRSPDGQDYIPKVVLATVQDWYEKSKWFYMVNETTVVHIYGQDMKVFEWDDAIKKKVDEITAPYETDQDKRWAILHWVAQHIRYSGISMGKGEGYTLHPGIMIFRDRCGVCKDIAGMALTMFRAAGYKAYPTMTMAGARVERIPADQFNHCVVAVDISGEPGVQSDNLPGTKWEMYDPTWAPNSMDIWSRAEGDQNIVIGPPEGEDLMAIRPYTPEENRFTINSTGSIDKNGAFTGTLEISALGYADARLRRIVVYSGNREQFENRISSFIGGIAPGAEVTNIYHDNVLDFANPMTLKIDYKISDYALFYDDGIHFQSPAARFMPSASYLFLIFGGATLTERENPMLLWAPQQVVISETIKIPKGYKLGDFEPITEGGDFADFSASVEQQGNKVNIAYKYTVSERYIEPHEYPQVKATADGMNDFAELNIHLWR